MRKIILGLILGGCSTTRVIVKNCIDIDVFGKYKSCEAEKRFSILLEESHYVCFESF